MPVDVTVNNSAPVSVPIGVGTLSYAISTGGAMSGSAAGVARAAVAGNTHGLTLEGSTPGVSSGTMSIVSSSQAVANGSFERTVATTVLGHATPSFSAKGVSSGLNLDFGIWAMGAATPVLAGSISNLADPSGYTAGLDLDGIAPTGDCSKLGISLDRFRNLAPGSTASFDAFLDTGSIGQLLEKSTSPKVRSRHAYQPSRHR